MAKFQIAETVGITAKTVRLGAGTGAANYLTSAEVGKAVKLAGSSRYNLVVAGDEIEGIIVAVEGATLDDYTIGSIRDKNYLAVTFDGLQGTPGTGVVAVGDYVVVGTAVAKGTALSGALKVTKATVQPSNSAFVGAYNWRVVSTGTAGTGAAGTAGVVERVNG